MVKRKLSLVSNLIALCCLFASINLIAQDKKSTQTKEKKPSSEQLAVELMTRFHKGLFSGEEKTVLKTLDDATPEKSDFDYMFGKEIGSDLHQEYLKFLETSKKGSKKIVDQFKNVKLESVEVELLPRSERFPYMKKLPKDIQVYEFNIDFNSGGGSGGNVFVFEDRAVFIKEFEFREIYARILKEK